MTDLLLTVGASNLILSLGIATIAYIVQRSGKLPTVAHVLWLLVLVKLLTPPVLSIPIVEVHRGTDALPAVQLPETLTAVQAAALETVMFDAGTALGQTNDAFAPPTAKQTMALALANWFAATWKVVALSIWALGSAIVLFWTLLRIFRFQRLLQRASDVAPPHVQDLAESIARRLGLRRAPHIWATSAHLSPMVWWIGGPVRIVVPDALLRRDTTDQLRWILGHELAHVRRRDHLVRWLEWLACVAFWWNPVAWWARRNLRINEEICCDALVLSTLRPAPRTYANALMTVVELLASPALRPPAVASELKSGGFLEKRFNMIVTHTTINRSQQWIRAAAIVGAAALLPVGVSIAQTTEPNTESEIQKEEVQSEQDAFRTILAEMILEGTIDERTAVEIYIATEEESRAKAIATGKFTEENFNDVLAMELLTTVTSLRIRDAVASGEMTEAEAEDELLAIQVDMEAVYREKSDFGVQKRAIQNAYDAGEITEVQAHDRLMALHRSAGIPVPSPKPDPLHERFEAAASEIKNAVESGALTDAEGSAKLQELRLQFEIAVSRRSRENLAGAEAEVKAMIANGKLTEAEGKKKLEALRNGLTSERHARTSAEDRHAQIELELQALVKAGEIQQQEVEKRLAQMKDNQAQGQYLRQVTHDQLAAIKAELEAAVQSGRMTDEEAQTKVEALHRESMNTP